ncbi:MAG: hypothetical protein QXE64_00970 [Candidatus Pacearchaeota archaeon]
MKELIALFDLDDTLVDYAKVLRKDLEKMRCPSEPKIKYVHGKLPRYIKKRINFIKSSEDWWANLPKRKLGWDILKVVKKMGFRVIILSKTPEVGPPGFGGKKRWIEKNLGKETEVILASDKGLVYGKVLVDDSPIFIKRWLAHRPRGLVIMPATSENKGFTHPQVIRYNGKNLEQIKKALKKVKLVALKR